MSKEFANSSWSCDGLNQFLVKVGQFVAVDDHAICWHRRSTGGIV